MLVMRRVAAALATCTLLSATAAAQQTLVEHLGATDLFAVADRLRAGGRTAEAATIYDALAHDPEPNVRAEARFREGLMFADLHRYRDAAVAFRAVLDQRPDATRVRLELARVLALLGDEAAARRELRQAEANGLPPDVLLTVNQFARGLVNDKRAGGSLELALAPDSNVNRATQQRTLDTTIAPLTLSSDARAQSGLGLKLAGDGYLRIPVTEELTLVPRSSALSNLYRSAQFNDASADGLVGLEWRVGVDRLSGSVGGAWRWYGDRPFARTWTAAADYIHPAGQRAQLLLNIGASTATFLRNSLQNGKIYSGSAGYERALSRRAGVETTLSVTRESARDPGYATWSEGISLFGWRDAGRGTLSVSAGVHRLDGDAALFLFPDRRREWLLDASAGLTLRKLTFRGLAPIVRLTTERNISTVGLYDYKRVSGELGLTRAF
jgi:outer membrane protein